MQAKKKNQFSRAFSSRGDDIIRLNSDRPSMRHDGDGDGDGVAGSTSTHFRTR